LQYKLKYRGLPGQFAVCQLPAGTQIPDWAQSGGFFSVTRTAEELSIVCEDSSVPDGIRAERNWVAMKLAGPFPFALTGVLASFLQPLAEQSISIFAVSTFDTDYVLIKRGDLETASRALAEAGHAEITNA